LFEHLLALKLAHLHVEQNDVGNPLLARGKQLVRVPEGADRVKPVVLQRVFQIIAEIRIVVQDGKVN
jgi:hypothetical protein